jgi:hypothetical protein
MLPWYQLLVNFDLNFEYIFNLIYMISGFVTECDSSASAVNLSFKPSFDEGALLTVAWSNSRIQHVPFYFANIQDDYANNAKDITCLSYMN